MFNPLIILAIVLIYLVLLFLLAFWVEKKAAAGTNIGNNAYIYSLSLTVYVTAWSFYGSVGKAASAGMLFLPIYLGPSIACVVWWTILKKLLRIRNTYRISSIADLLSLRYNKSLRIAALSTLIMVVGVVPYISLQLKSIILTSSLISQKFVNFNMDLGLIFVLSLIFFTIIFGARRLIPTERHQGMVVVIAVMGLVKLISFLAIGYFVTYYLFTGVQDIFTDFLHHPGSRQILEIQSSKSYFFTWASYFLLALFSFMFLPKVYHMSVIENFEEKHIFTAMWLFPLYMFLFAVFVLPIAMAGLILGYPAAQADVFVLALPLNSGHPWVSIFGFLGGFSAAMGMTIVSTLAVSIMVTNHFVLPLSNYFKRLNFLKRYVLLSRWSTIAILILSSYWVERQIGAYFSLVDMGLISFAAIIQLVPAIIGGFYWKRANESGAFLGISAGFIVWLYTMIVPLFAQNNTIISSLVKSGPWGIGLLIPEHLFGLCSLSPVSNAVLWTLFFNISFYIFGSLYFEQAREEQLLLEEFVSVPVPRIFPIRHIEMPTIDSGLKMNRIKALFSQYLPGPQAVERANQCFFSLSLSDKNMISILELSDLRNEVERLLSSFVGVATAHQVLINFDIFTPEEEQTLKRAYSDIIAELKLPPSELLAKIDYYRDRELILASQAKELEEKIQERDNEISTRKQVEELLRNSERKLADILDFLPDATFAINTNGEIILWNKKAEELFGKKASEMLGKGNYEYSIPFYGTRRPALVDYVLHSSEEIGKMYVNLRKEDGSIIGEELTLSAERGGRHIFGTASPLYDFEGTMIGVIESLRDITDQKKTETEIMELTKNLERRVAERTKQLEAANKELEAFSYSVSHDLRAPLRSIGSFCQILVEEYEDVLNSQGKDYLSRINNAVNRMNMLIDDLLRLSRISRTGINYRKVNLSKISWEILSELMKDNPNRKVEIKVQPDVIAECDLDLLRIVLENILGNAWKFTSKKEIARIEFGTVVQDKKTVYFIRDNGAGFDQNYIDKVFLPFQRLHSTDEFPGSGIGLTIVKRIIDRHGGNIWAEGTIEGGSVFYFTL
ncbi:MAG TPA: diguanylate cyclase [Candidatus Margulisbacteria bacterium]|nr:diguanylate cyclase [Candidatus Margulisiibacteriota bacterium]